MAPVPAWMMMVLMASVLGGCVEAAPEALEPIVDSCIVDCTPSRLVLPDCARWNLRFEADADTAQGMLPPGYNATGLASFATATAGVIVYDCPHGILDNTTALDDFRMAWVFIQVEVNETIGSPRGFDRYIVGLYVDHPELRDAFTRAGFQPENATIDIAYGPVDIGFDLQAENAAIELTWAPVPVPFASGTFGTRYHAALPGPTWFDGAGSDDGVVYAPATIHDASGPFDTLLGQQPGTFDTLYARTSATLIFE